MYELNMKTIYDLSTIQEMFARVRRDVVVKKERVIKSDTEAPKVDVTYYNIPAGYDTETSSWMEDGAKKAMTYAFMIGIDDSVAMVREWNELLEILELVRIEFGLDVRHRMVIYVHNLSYEFQFIRKRLNVVDMFAVDSRSPLYVLTEEGFVFRDSCILSALSLAKTAEGLMKYKVEKKVGQLNYDLVRHSRTPLTHKEVEYCVDDVFVILAYIQEKIEEHGTITDIPLTNTGYVRRFVGEMCRSNKGYHSLMRRLTIGSKEELMTLVRAFSGGFTHAAHLNVGKTHENVVSMDLCSAYPAVAAYKQFPMSRGLLRMIKSKKQLWFYVYNFCCIFDVEFVNLKSKANVPDHYISASKCEVLEGCVDNDNGRVVEAKRLRMTVTEVDFKLIMKHYTCSEYSVGSFRTYKRGYLPREIVEAILDLYEAKTTLKGLHDRVEEYMKKKGMLNSVYGMIVTAILKDLILYRDGEWEVQEVNVDEVLQKYNSDHSRFLYYPWGAYITAYVREIIWGAIDECGSDYIYSDTDSVKMLNFEKHREYFARFNNGVVAQLKQAMEHHGIEFEGRCNPRTVKGVEKVLGVFEIDGEYTRFKTLGAKRYLYEEDGEIHLTCAGVNKKEGLKWLLKTAKNKNLDVFELFADGLEIPGEGSGKMTCTYIDTEISGKVVDYLGNVGEYHEMSFVHMEKATYHLTVNEDYLAYLEKIFG